MNYTLVEIAEKIGATVIYASKDSELTTEITSIATLENASKGQIAFLSNSKYREQLSSTQATAVIINRDSVDACKTNALVMDNPYVGYALVAQLLDSTPAPASEIHASAVISSNVTLGKNVSIGANSVIESGVTLGDNVCIGANCFIGKNSTLGSNTSLWSNISIYHNIEIGQDCLIQANSIIGSDGFGYAKNKGQWIKIPQLGSVIIGNRVEIGASTTIDRGALDNTIIKDGVILDNQIQIAHNVVVGENTAIAACSVIAGSSTIGNNCTIAGLVGINGHINIVDGCVFTGMTMVTKSMVKPGVYSSGMPAAENKEWNKTNARIRKLESLTKRVKELEGQFSLLKK